MKLPLYDYLNIMLTGVVFIFSLIIIDIDYFFSMINLILGVTYNYQNIIISIFLFLCIYEIGLIINRIGAVFIENIFRSWGIFYFNDNYNVFNEKKNKYPILGVLSREYSVSRTSIALYLIIGIIYFFYGLCLWSIFSFALVGLFTLSARKYTKMIINLMNDEVVE